MNAPELKPRIVVIDDHEMILNYVVPLLQQKYPDAEVQTAQTRQEGLERIASFQPGLVVMDLAIPDRRDEKPTAEIGVGLVEMLMRQYPTLNIAVLSGNTNPLIRLKPQIDNHEGGFTVSDKGWSYDEISRKVNMAFEGGRYLPKDMKLGLEFRPEWLELLQLAFQEGLTDKMIAKRMNVSEKTVQNYFHKVQDVLEVYPEEGQNLRIQTSNKARKAGLID